MKTEQKYHKLMAVAVLIAAAVFLGGCKSTAPQFDGEKAFAVLEQQCAFGPRNPGSEGYNNCRQYLIEQLEALADTVILQNFTLVDPLSAEEYVLTNIIGRFNPESSRRVLLGAHWDTRPWADRDPDPERRSEPILGANDGASGVAVLLEIGRLLAENPPQFGVEIVFFDGEDLGVPGEPRSYARGSHAFASDLPIEKPDEAIILDMIGDANLSIPMELYSTRQNPALVRKLWKMAAELELPAFQNRVLEAIYDDHIPLWEQAGIPSIDIIDFNYPDQFTNYWHTHRDVPQNCSAASLEQVGKLITHYIYEDSD